MNYVTYNIIKNNFLIKKLQINYSLFKIKNNILTNSYEQDQQLLAFRKYFFVLK